MSATMKIPEAGVQMVGNLRGAAVPAAMGVLSAVRLFVMCINSCLSVDIDRFPAGKRQSLREEPSGVPRLVGPSQPAAGGAFPTPNSFPEKLFHVLENSIAPESLWWLGEGEALAVHPHKIQTSPVLESYFQGNRYSSFIRNLNRW